MRKKLCRKNYVDVLKKLITSMKLAQLVYVLKQYLIKKDIQEVNLSVKENQQLNLIKHEKTENKYESFITNNGLGLLR